MNPAWVLIIVLIVLLFAGYPRWGYHTYGYYPSGIIGIILIIVIVLLFMGHL